MDEQGEIAESPRHELWLLYARPDIPWPGWSELLGQLHEELVSVDPDYDVRQVKEKDGGLRFYASFDGSVAAECEALVREAERRSFEICERCGGPGHLRTERQHLLTLCDRCNGLV